MKKRNNMKKKENKYEYVGNKQLIEDLYSEFLWNIMGNASIPPHVFASVLSVIKDESLDTELMREILSRMRPDTLIKLKIK